MSTASDTAAWARAGARPKPRRRFAVSARDWVRLREEATAVMRTEMPPSAMTARHFVAAYAVLHAEVYGDEAPELESPKGRAIAGKIAGDFLRRQFPTESEHGFDPSSALHFVRWVWQRERRDEDRRREDGEQSEWRVVPRYQFSAKLLLGYRLAMKRGSR